HGRLWRLSWQSDPVAARKKSAPRFDSATPAELVQHLDHANPWWRETAQRLLVERQDGSVQTALANLVGQARAPQGRMQAPYTLEGLSKLEPSAVVQALGDESGDVRVHSLRFAERWLDKEPAVLVHVLKLTRDPEPRVRLQLALTLGESRQAQAVEALARLA